MIDLSKLNNGEAMPVTDSFGGYMPTQMVVRALKFKYGKESDVQFLKDSYPESIVLFVDLETKDGKQFTQWQFVNTKKDGELANPAQGGFMGKNGEVPATLMYDIREAIKNTMSLEDFVKEFPKGEWKITPYLNKPFLMGLKTGTSKEGKEYFILETSYQKMKDSQYAQDNSDNGGSGVNYFDPKADAKGAEQLEKSVKESSLSDGLDLPWENAK